MTSGRALLNRLNRTPECALRYFLSAFASRRRRLSLAAALLLLGVVAACAPSIDEREAVHVLTYDGVVDPVMVGYIDRGIDEAEDTDARAVVLRLDTPGGLVTSMEKIVKRIDSSKVPVIVYVWPSTGQAASAGTFITMAAHVSVMAPATVIGAASPVGAGGADIEGTLGEKITEDGITAERLADSDVKYSVNIMVDGQRIHRVIGLDSDGVTRSQAEIFIEFSSLLFRRM